MSKNSTPDLESVFSAKSIAIIGASAACTEFNAGSFSGMNVVALKQAGFPAIYPVNPRYNEVYGLPCYSSLLDIPGNVDYVMVAVPAGKALQLMDECIQKGVKTVHFFTSGFAESGDKDSIELERKILKKARQGGIRIIGPNCIGLSVPRTGQLQDPLSQLEPGNVALMSQSGGYAQDTPLNAFTRGIRFSKVISYGNALDINECDLLDYFADDNETEIIAAYIEGVRDGRRFYKALQKAAAKKPVVICKGGITEAGLTAANSHTASVTSSVDVFRALCHQANAIMVNDTQEMIDALVALYFTKPYPAGKGVVALGQGGGTTVLAGDQMELAGLKFARLSAEIDRELRSFLVTVGSIYGSAIDAPELLEPKSLLRALKVVGKAPGVDMIMYHMGLHPATRWGYGRFSSEQFLQPAAEAFSRAKAELRKPVLLTMGMAWDENGMKEMLHVRAAFVKAGLPVFYDISKASTTMSRIVDWNKRFSQIAN